MFERSSLVLATLALASLGQRLDAQEGPPGLVLVKGGKTKIGSDVKELEPLIEKNRQFANTFAGETPRHTVEVDDFYLMPTEVTNEQYAVFVRATGHVPPYYWATGDDVEKGRMAFIEEQGKLKADARAAGQKPPATKLWDAPTWWAANWEGKDWEVPADQLTRPVTYVSYDDAMAYARWAGLRLPTEFEMQRAIRGDGDRQYPWGDEWNPALCNSLEYKAADHPVEIGSFPDGAVDGLFDLVGNVFEWTSSKYTKFPGYKEIQVKVGKEKVVGLANFDPVQRVLAGGSFVNGPHACRATSRMPASKEQRTEAVGFRCAANTASGEDVANAILEEDVRLSVLPGEVDFKPGGSAILQRWETSDGTASIAAYSVIEKYERTLFTPLLSLDASSKSILTKLSDEQGPVIIGMLSFEHPLRAPELDGGTYFLAWRGAGKLREEEEEDAGQANLRLGDRRQGGQQFHEVYGFDEEQDCLFFYDLEGKPIVAWTAPEVEFERPKQGSSMNVVAWVPPAEEPDPEAPPVIPMDTLEISVVVDAGRKALLTTVELKVEPKTFEGWK